MSKDNEKEIESSYVIEITKETQEVRESEEPTKVKKIIQTETITQSNENDGDSKDSERSSGAGMRNKYKKKKGTSDSNNNLDNLESSIKNNIIENETKIIEDDKELKQSIIDGVKNKKIGKFNKSQNEEGSVSKTEITIIKTEEITEEQNNISNPSANLKSNKPRDSKGGMTVSKVTEISSSSNQENKEGGKKDEGLLDINNSTNKEEKSEEKDNKIDVQTNDSIGLFGKKRKRERERERERKSNDSTNEPERSKQIISKTNDSDDTNPGKQRFRKRKSNDSTNEPDGSRQIISKTNDSNDINPGKQRLRERKSNDSTNDPKGSKPFRTLTNDSNDTTPGKQRLRERKSNDSTNDPKGSKPFRTLTNDSNDTTPGKKGQRDRRTNDVTKDSNKPNEGRRGFNNKDDKDKNRNNPDSSKEKIISQIYIRKTGLNSNRDIETPRIGNERDTNSNVQNNSNLNQGRPGQRGIRPSEKSSQSNLNDRSGRRDNNPSQNISKERTSKNEQNPYQNPFLRNREPDDKQKASNRRQPNQMVSNTNKGFKQENPRDSARSNNRNNPNVSKDKDKPYGQRITKITEVRTSTNDPNQGGRRPNPKDSNRSINQSNPNVSKDKDKTTTQRITKITEVKSTINAQNQGGRRGNPRDSDRPNNQNKPNDKLMYNQKQTFNNPFVSTPNIRDKNGRRTANEKPQNRLNSKDNKKNIPPLYNRQNTDTDIPRNNTVRHLIDETGKIPKKEYVLNVRKLDTIKDTKRHKQTYNDSITGDDKPISSNFNHNMIVVKNVTKEYKTVADVDYEPIKHRYNYSFVPGLPNTYVHTIDESGKNPKKQKEVSPRKNQIIRTERKPSKLVYTMSEYKIGERIPYNDNSNSNNNNNNNNLRNRKNVNEPRGGNRNQNTLDANNNRKRPNQIMSGRMTPGNDKNNQRNNRNRNDGNNARNKSELGKRENSRDVYKKQVSSKLDTSKNNASNRRVTQEYSKTIETTSNRTGKDFLKSNRNKDDSRKGQRGDQSSKIEIVIEKKSIIVDEENDSSNRRKKRNSAGSVKKDDKSSKFQITSSTRNMEVRSKDDSANGPAKKLRRYKKI